MSAADMSERLAPDNAALLEGDAVAAVVGDGAAVVVADCRLTASMDAHCKEAASSCREASDYTRRLTIALMQRSE